MSETVLSELIKLDHYWFHKINGVWTHPILDKVMPIITDLHKVPTFYRIILPIALIIWFFYDRLRAVGILLTCLLAFAITDASAHQVLKSSIQRHRPSFTLPNVQLRTNAHAGYSFPSNHAANMFAVATVLGFFSSYWLPLFFFIAGIIAYSRVYVGVHFPLDVVAGAIYGILMANIAIWIALKTLSIYKKHKGLPNPPLKR